MPATDLPLRGARVLACGLIALAANALVAGFAWAEDDDDDPRPAAGIQDNSFLIEEAYNQKAGEVQHIATLQRQRRDWFFGFTQEWSLGSQTHQGSYSIPYSWLRSEGQRARGIGDITFSYRYQALMETATMPAVAPSVTLIVPSGSRRKGLGDGSYGVEFKLPFSKIVSDHVTLHANAGMTHLFDVYGHSPKSFMVGGSGVYAVTRDFNLLLEGLVEWNESVNDARELERETALTISPGFRKAFNFPDDKQLVLGFATPISFVRHKPTDYGLFFYLSFEHSFLKKKSSR
ncbi:MAG: transporter [Xanthobacteraceae bacterium]